MRQPNPLKPTAAALQRAGHKSYATYLRSTHWASIRKLALILDRSCPCGRPGTQLHHRHYDLLGKEEEDLDCLQWLCGDCHPFVHNQTPRPSDAVIPKSRRPRSSGKLRTRPRTRKGEGAEALAKALAEMEAEENG